MNNSRPNTRKSIEQREKEFCTHWNNANSELADNIRKNNPGSRKSKHPSFKKAWGSENKPENLPKTEETDGKSQNEEPKPKRERKGWGVPRSNPVETQEQEEQQAITNISDEKRSESPLKEIQKENYSSNTSNEDIVVKKNFDSVGSREEVSIENKENKENKEMRDVISNFKSLDLQKLRQQKKEEKLKKAAQEPEKPKDSPKIEKLAQITELKLKEEKPKKSVRSDDIEEEIEEEIVEEINDDPVEPIKEVSKPTNRVDSSYGKKPALKRVTRPLTANVNYGYNSNFRTADPILANVPTKEKQPEPKKNLELKKDKVKNVEINLKPEDNTKLVQKEKTKKEQVPDKKNPLVKRVESLDASTKKLLENILEKIEAGSFDKEDLENLEASDN